MTIEDIQTICGKWAGVTQDIKWENHLCFNVGEKMFLVTAPDEVPISASFKVADEEFDEVSARPGCKPAPYMARYKWVWIDDINRIGKKEWTRLLTSSYDQVAAKLPAKKRKELGL
ncbi:MmcQ/YjbR family DNA-binding protein [Paraflavitalea sp. CAU 1676]|uniref:MmcQ/YjbR family DNA-binding protein n=1 Tax=Paraflavitalea sp. CAU 1676 TaxID=3032598 RepID=UPI0023DAD25B|nr:MmcQ/YjbR family DNA-binding protein [Paraflavitalea sp. CAU 1676]MDF2192534.1 MmcQ/YjbR family DNA-binding protein [Paraflavitalea sp. CAU 1676]